MKTLRDRGLPSAWMNRGDSGGCWTYLYSDLRAVMVHVCALGVLAMVTATPFLKGSIFEDGMVRVMCDGDDKDGQNWMQLLVMLMPGSNALPGCTVNLPHLRKPEKAVVTVAFKLSCLSRDKCVVAVSMFLST